MPASILAEADDTFSPYIWLANSKQWSERLDSNYKLDEEGQKSRIDLPSKTRISNEAFYLVYKWNPVLLLRKCLKCSEITDDINEMKCDGTYARFKLSCLTGCGTSWSVQSE